MNYEEQTIIDFLKQCPDNFFGRKEIARKAVRRSEFEENPHWADVPLAALADQKLIEIDNGNLYRFKADR